MYQLGGIITGELSFNFFTIVAAVILVAFIYLLVRPNKYVNDNEVKIDVQDQVKTSQNALKGVHCYDGVPGC